MPGVQVFFFFSNFSPKFFASLSSFFFNFLMALGPLASVVLSCYTLVYVCKSAGAGLNHQTALLILLFSRIVYGWKKERAFWLYWETKRLWLYILRKWEIRKWRQFIDKGLAKPKEARYLRMQNDFPGEEQLPTEGGIKKTRFRSYSVSSDGGAAKKAELWTQRECVTVRRWQSCMGTIIIHQKTLRSQGWCLRLKLHTDTANQKL